MGSIVVADEEAVDASLLFTGFVIFRPCGLDPLKLDWDDPNVFVGLLGEILWEDFLAVTRTGLFPDLEQDSSPPMETDDNLDKDSIRSSGGESSLTWLCIKWLLCFVESEEVEQT